MLLSADTSQEQRLSLIHILDEPPLAQKDGGIIREGYHEDVDKFRRSRTDGKKWLTELEVDVYKRQGKSHEI